MKSSVLSKETLDAAIQQLIRHDKETDEELALLYDSHGKLVSATGGGNDEVGLAKAGLELCAGGVLLHNHPENSGSLSDADLFCAGAHHIREIWAINQDGSIFKSSGTFPSMITTLKCNILFTTVGNNLSRFVDNGTITEAEACRIWGHWQNLQLLQDGSVKNYEWQFGPVNQATIAKIRQLAQPGQPMEQVGLRFDVFNSDWN